MSQLLTFKQAAKITHRSVRTLNRWAADGMKVAWFSGVRYVWHDVLIAEAKTRNEANPSKLTTAQWDRRQQREAEKARRDTQTRK